MASSSYERDVSAAFRIFITIMLQAILGIGATLAPTVRQITSCVVLERVPAIRTTWGLHAQ